MDHALRVCDREKALWLGRTNFIGCELGKLTERVCKKRGSKRFMAYKIPRVCA